MARTGCGSSDARAGLRAQRDPRRAVASRRGRPARRRPDAGRRRARRQRRRHDSGLDRGVGEDRPDRSEGRLRRPVRRRRRALHGHGGERRAVQGRALRRASGAAQARREDAADERLPDAPQRRPAGRCPGRHPHPGTARPHRRRPPARHRQERRALPDSRQRPRGDVESRLPLARRIGRAPVRVGAGEPERQVLHRQVPPEAGVRPARLYARLDAGPALQRDRLLRLAAGGDRHPHPHLGARRPRGGAALPLDLHPRPPSPRGASRPTATTPTSR